MTVIFEALSKHIILHIININVEMNTIQKWSGENTAENTSWRKFVEGFKNNLNDNEITMWRLFEMKIHGEAPHSRVKQRKANNKRTQREQNQYTEQSNEIF
jgi:FMN-dependent NADH-azoreductase